MMVNFINELWEQSMSKTIQAEQDLKNAFDKLKCDECKNENDTISNNEFNKLLCDDCYTNYRVTLQNMFNLKNLFEVDDLLSNIRGDSEDFFKDRELDK